VIFRRSLAQRPAQAAPGDAGGRFLFAAGRIPALDGLRGLAALSVFVFHAWLYTLAVPNVAHASGLGDYLLRELRLGLVLFFVLSGFVLYRPWARAGKRGSAPPRLGRYLRSRAARVLPAYYVALSAAILLLWGLNGSPGVRLPPLESLPLFLVFGQNLSGATVMTLDPPMWTLAIEVAFYVALPLLGWLALRLGRSGGRRFVVPAVLMLIGLAWNIWVAARGLPLPYSKSLPAMLPYFAAGMVAAVALEQWRPSAAGAKRLAAAGLALVVGHVGLRVATSAGWLAVPALGWMRDLPAAAGFAAIIAAAASRPARGVLRARPVVALGTVSYGFYLWQVPLLVWARGYGLLPLDPLLAVVVVLPVALVVATLSWMLVERPVQAAARSMRGVLIFTHIRLSLASYVRRMDTNEKDTMLGRFRGRRSFTAAAAAVIAAMGITGAAVAKTGGNSSTPAKATTTQQSSPTAPDAETPDANEPADANDPADKAGANEPADKADANEAPDANEPADNGKESANKAPDSDGPGGHADEPANPNANTQN